MASVEVQQMLAAAVAACEDKKAEDIRILALDPAESGLTDFFLICTGTNDRQTVAITDEIEIRLKREFGTYPNAVEGRRQGDWVLMDYVDFIVHVFLPERRAFYGLERLRPSATTLSVNELNAEIKAAITSGRAAAKSNREKALANPVKRASAASKVTTKKPGSKKMPSGKAPATKIAEKKTAEKRVPAKKVSAKASAKKSPAKPTKSTPAPSLKSTAAKASAKRSR